MLRYLLTRSLRETAFPRNEHQTTAAAPAYARRFSARNWIIPSAYASAYALALLQFAYASLRNSGFGLREASYDTTLSTHVKGGLGRCSPTFTWNPNDPCFDWKRPCFGGFNHQNRGQTGSRYNYSSVCVQCDLVTSYVKNEPFF